MSDAYSYWSDFEDYRAKPVNKTKISADRFEDAWVIMKKGLFYRPDCSGYTVDIRDAGAYTEEFAKDYASSNPREISATPVSQWLKKKQPTPGTVEYLVYFGSNS